MKKTILVLVLFVLFSLTAFAEDVVTLPILMYHSIDSQAGNYTVTPHKFESDIKALKASGYTPVFFSQVIDFVYNGTPLPEKPVIITLDDGYMNNYTEVYPIVQRNNVKIEIFGIAGALEYSDKFFYAEHALEMEKSGLANIGCHTYNLHDDINNLRIGIERLDGESFREWEHLFRNDLMLAQRYAKNYLGKEYNTFAYPFGKFSAESEKILKEEGYLVSVTTEPGINKIVRNSPESLRLLMRISMDNINAPADAYIDLFKNNQISGKIVNAKNTFVPDYVSRADALEVILENELNKEVDYSFADGYFDIDFYSEKVKKIMTLAVGEYLIAGYSDLTLRPTHYLTRGEFALMLARYLRFDDTPVTSSFTDASDWNSAAIEFCNQKGYMIGYGETFGTDDFLTREQLLIIKSRLNK